MGVFYDIRVHLGEDVNDYTDKKASTVAMGIWKVTSYMHFCILPTFVIFEVQFASADIKQRSPTSTADKGFMFGSGA